MMLKRSQDATVGRAVELFPEAQMQEPSEHGKGREYQDQQYHQGCRASP